MPPQVRRDFTGASLKGHTFALSDHPTAKVGDVVTFGPTDQAAIKVRVVWVNAAVGELSVVGEHVKTHEKEGVVIVEDA